jgi:hypothetical protein
MLLCELFEAKKKPKSKLVRKKLRVKHARNRKHVPVIVPPALPKRAKKKSKQLNKK